MLSEYWLFGSGLAGLVNSHRSGNPVSQQVKQITHHSETSDYRSSTKRCEMEMEPPDVADDHSSASHQGPFFSSFLFLNAGLAALSFLAFICPSRLRRCQQQEDGGMAVLNALSAGVLVGCV